MKLAPPSLPSPTSGARSSLRDFHGIHRGQAIVVCGCGESLNTFDRAAGFITIGVNDVGRRFDPNYLVVVNPRDQFTADRFRFVETSQAQYLFTQYDDLLTPGTRQIRIRLGQYAGTHFDDPDALHFTQNSPYVALCLAVHMGARHIGLIGVDFTDNHFFGNTGSHPLTPQLEQIDQQYGALRAACRARGIEIVNLSSHSRLKSLPKTLLNVWPPQGVGDAARTGEDGPSEKRVLLVNYNFLSCGDVFGRGLRRAAEDCACPYEEASWDDAQLPERVERFKPDLIFVVHGRRFAERWGDAFRGYNTAVWLVDEPYEVDDTAGWSGYFTTVFVNDPSTLGRHRNAHYLPTCCDPRIHWADGRERPYKVGFVGGYNATRERYLMNLADAGLLSYVVGGPWTSPSLRALCLGGSVSPQQTAELYRNTQIVLNVFREVHHFNRERLAATSMNPRIYEALACGAVVISERRAEIESLIPDLPQVERPEEIVPITSDWLARCMGRVAAHFQWQNWASQQSYADRLTQTLEITCSAGTPRACRW